MKNKHLICIILVLVIVLLFLICFTSCTGKTKMKKIVNYGLKERLSPALRYEEEQRKGKVIEGFFPEYRVDVPPMKSTSPFYNQIQHEMPPQMPPQIPPQMPPQMPPEIQPQIPPEIQPQIPPEIPPQMLPQMPPEIQPQIPPEMPPQIKMSYNRERLYTPPEIEKFTPYYKERFFPEYTSMVKPLTTDSPFYGPITMSTKPPESNMYVPIIQNTPPSTNPKMSSYSPFYGIINGGV